ncbi:14291_t:CDS:2, partial [Racocetra fulgida]
MTLSHNNFSIYLLGYRENGLAVEMYFLGILWRFITEIRQNIVKVSVSTISATSTSSASTSFSHLEKEQKVIEFERKGTLGIACIKISAVLFCSSLIYLIWAELWWTDSAATLLFSIFFAKEGGEMITWAKDKNFTGGYSSQIATNGERQGSNCKTDEESEIGTNKEKGRHLRVSVNDDEQVEESTSIGGAWWRENGTDIELENLAKSVKNGTETSFSIAI